MSSHLQKMASLMGGGAGRSLSDARSRSNQPPLNPAAALASLDQASREIPEASNAGSFQNHQHTARTKAASLPPAAVSRAGEITLEKCLQLLLTRSPQLQERPAHLNDLDAPYALFMEAPKQKRTASKWGAAVGAGANRADRWANSGGVSGAHDYFVAGQTVGATGVRKRYGRIVRPNQPLLKFFEFTILRVEPVSPLPNPFPTP